MINDPIEQVKRSGPSNARIAWWRLRFYFTSILFYWANSQQRFVFYRHWLLFKRKSVQQLEEEETPYVQVRYLWPILLYRRYVMMFYRAVTDKDKSHAEGYSQAYMMLIDGVDERKVAHSVGSYLGRSAFEAGWCDACSDWDATPYPF